MKVLFKNNNLFSNFQREILLQKNPFRVILVVL